MKYKLINSVSKKETICDKVVVDGWDYYVSEEKIHFGYVWNNILEQIETMFKEKPFHDDLKGIIATTNPFIDLPKMVDEVEILSSKLFENHSTNQLSPQFETRKMFIHGYNKSQETHPFSEEDVCDFVEWMNLHYRALEHTISFKGVEGTKELLQIWEEQQPKTLYYEAI